MKVYDEFSLRSRTRSLRKMEQDGVDLLVIGGGITGAGIAWDAAMRGLKVGLVEQRDFAFGTSSRSTKLIHGGLRYLAQGEIGLVQEVGRERAILHRLAAHLVHPIPLLLPIYERGQYGKWGTSIGLWLYDRLAGVKRSERRTMLSKKQTMEREPGLRIEGLRGGGLYVEYRTDDSRLTLEVLKTAHSQGALIANYAQVKQLSYAEDGRVNGAVVEDRLNGQTLHIPAKIVVNAAGPWVDEVRKMDGELTGKRLHLTKGVHLTVNYADLPVKHALYIGTDDGRMVFIIPRGTSTYIGTTDTTYVDDISKPVCTREDVEYLLRAVNAHFPGLHLHSRQVQSSWAGLRPLLHEEGKSPSELSRKEEIFKSASGFYSIAGGKLTGFRKMAEKIVDRVASDLQVRDRALSVGPCITGKTMISGGDVGPDGYQAFYDLMVQEGRSHFGLTPNVIDRLVTRYGSNIRTIFGYLKHDAGQKQRVGLVLPILRAEVTYAVEQEMVVSLTDFLLRRTGDLLFHAEETMRVAPLLLNELAKQLGWDPEEQLRQWRQWEDAVREARGFRLADE